MSGVPTEPQPTPQLDARTIDVLIRNILTSAYFAGYEEANRPFRNSHERLRKLVREGADDIKTICGLGVSVDSEDKQ